MGQIIKHPSAERSPQVALAEALDVAVAGQILDVCIVYTDHSGCIHVGWSAQSTADLASAALALQAVATQQLLD